MRRVLKWLGIGVAGLLGLVLVAVIGIFAVSGYILNRSHEAKAETLSQPGAALLADAPRQARILGCVSCHGEGLKGKVMFDAPNVAKVIAPNLTQIAARATDQQLAAAVRQGIAHDGRALFVMPSPQYSRLSDAEVAALIAYIRSLPRTPGSTERPTIRPLARLGIAMGSFASSAATVEEYRTKMPIPVGAEHEPGRQLAAKDCSECHGPALDGKETFEGNAPDLSIVGAYDYDQFRTLLRTGKTPGNKKLGLMKEVAEQDFVHLTDGEIRQLHAYLQARAQKASK